MCYRKRQMVICFKTTENFGATWSIIFPARGSERKLRNSVLEKPKRCEGCDRCEGYVNYL